MLQVKRAGHSTLTTPDIGRMIDYFTRIVGLSLIAREKDRAILATKSGLEAIALERGDVADAPRLSFQIAPDSDLADVAARLNEAGIKCERRHDITPGIRQALAFKDPKGTTLEIFADAAFAADDDDFTGVMPLKLGHIAYQCPDVAGMVKFYCDMLGFRVSDWRSNFFAFLRCSRDHHTVNFLRDPKTAIHHIAFEVRDWSDIKRACDLLAKNDIKLTWGPLRHIIGHNIAIYHKSPDGGRGIRTGRNGPKSGATIHRRIGGVRCRTARTAATARPRSRPASGSGRKPRHSQAFHGPLDETGAEWLALEIRAGCSKS
jgi:catechol 2,3-dioxygenase-like lactoylglutathione lyase family enzyme